VIDELVRIVGRENVKLSEPELYPYAYDASYFQGSVPIAVAVPHSTEEVSGIVRLCNRHMIPYIGRGSGTNISGGTIPPEGALIIEFSGMNRVLEVDLVSQRAVIEPGVINLDLKEMLAPYGYTFAPDPGSQSISTIGGNAAENAGGPHCLKYGITTNHVTGLEVVLPSAEIAMIGGKAYDEPGYDLLSLFVGSEGTIGLITKMVVRIVHLPEFVQTFLGVFESVIDAANAVAAIISTGIIPATIELMDRITVSVVNKKIPNAYPGDADAVLLIEVDGLADGMDRIADKVCGILRASGSREPHVARTQQERDRLWLGRRGVFGAVARLMPDCYIIDVTVPRTRLPEAFEGVLNIAKKYDLLIANTSHAGDGNLHPCVMFDASNAEEKARVMKAGKEIAEMCVPLGGSITGEHGVGIEKREEMRLVFSDADLGMMEGVKEVFDERNLSNPGKVLPTRVGGL